MSSRGMNSRSHKTTAAFRKEARCPSSEELLNYCQDASRECDERAAELTRHLAVCDFCGAERQLLAAHPPHKTKPRHCAPAQMPVHLHALARALLVKSPAATRFVETMHAATGLTLTDA